ncbi:MAG: hypothetical protein IAE83_08895 [Anaerolinea sp.]|nr:hypothetical protein [Anaerolinea sp.]MCC6972905.1 hypothetical protein [Anaerolineae bacterium]
MTHQVSFVEGVLTVRLNGRCSAQEVGQAIQSVLLQQKSPITAIVDLTFASGFDQTLKATFFRMMQHPMINRLGICSSSPTIASDVNDLVVALSRARTVTTAATESEILVAFGLADPPTQPRKLTGMLAHLKRPTTNSQ